VAALHALGEPVGNEASEHLGRAVLAGQGRLVVEVAVVERAEHTMQLLGGPADVDEDPVCVELRAGERRVHDVRRTVQALRRAEHLAAQAVRDHDVVPHGHPVHHASSSTRVP
jgi:hypothetical protein